MRSRALFAALFMTVLTSPVLAHSYKAGGLEIGHPWARETPDGATVGAGYFKVKNNGSEADRLIGAESGGSERVEIHEGFVENGVAKMRKVDSVELPAGTSTALEPGGHHLMLINLKKPLVEGERIPAVLIFETAGRIEVELAVENMSYGRHGSGGGHDHGHGSDHKH